MNSILEFANHPDCITSLEALRAHAKMLADKGEVIFPYYYVNNIGAASYVDGLVSNSVPYLKVDDLFIYHSIWETMSRKNPNFIGNVDDFSDPRLSHLTIIVDGGYAYVRGENPEDITFHPGDCGGAFREDATNPYLNDMMHLQAWAWNEYASRLRRESLYLSYLQMPNPDDKLVKLIFTTKETASAYCDWAKQDETSINAYTAYLNHLNLTDRFIDSLLLSDHDDDHDDIDFRDYDDDPTHEEAYDES